MTIPANAICKHCKQPYKTEYNILARCACTLNVLSSDWPAFARKVGPYVRLNITLPDGRKLISEPYWANEADKNDSGKTEIDVELFYSVRFTCKYHIFNHEETKHLCRHSGNVFKSCQYELCPLVKR